MPDLPGTPQVPQLPLPSETVYQAVGQVMESDLLATALVRDDDGRIVWANGSYAAVTGYGFDEVAGRTQEFLHGPGTDTDVIDRARARVREGHAEPLTVLLYRKNGTPFWSRIAAVPISLDGTGQADYHAVIHFESTAEIFHERAQSAQDAIVENRADRLELVNRVVRALTSQVDYHRAADALARTAVPELADWGFVVLFDDDGAPEYFTQIVADPAKQESARAVRQDMPRWMEQHQALKVMALARPEDLVLPQLIDIGLLEKTISSPRVLRALDDLGLGARLPVPLCARNRTLGLMVLEARDPDRFDVPTVVTTSMLRGRVGTMLDNIRLYQAERATALTLQHRLLPPSVEVADLDTAAAYRPAGNRAEIGGDWYDVFPLGERGTMLAVGDVVGHDMSAAAVMGQLSLLLRARTWTSGSPGPSLTTIARVLDGMHWDDVASVVCLRWQPTTDGCHVEYTNLGHPAPLVRLPDGRVCQMRPAHGIPLGLHDPTVDLGQDELDLPAGSVVVLYTDGLVERRDRSLEDGLAALARALRDAPDGTTEQIRDHLLATLVHDQPEDDVCLLVVRGQTPAPPDRQIPPAPALLIPLDNVGRPARTTR